MSNTIPAELKEAYEKAVSYIFHTMPVSQMDIDSVIAEDVMIYGTNVDENIFGIDDFKRIMNMQAEEMKSLEPSFERIPVMQHVSDDERLALFIEEVKMIIKVGETVNISDVRMSFVMKNIDGSWKLIHGHGSKPVESEEDPWHVKEWQQEKEKLEKRVAEQTTDLQNKNRELEIEAASQRVRTEAMGMQKPEDIVDVLHVMKEEVDRFELGNIATWLWTITDGQKVVHWELADHLFEDGFKALNLVFDPHENSVAKTFIDQMGSEFFSYHYQEEALHNYVKSLTEFFPDVPPAFKDAIEAGEIIEMWQLCSTFSKGLVGLMFTSEPPDETKQILNKISDTFGLAYKRFEDLQEAESRRKEAELEAAVERVRSRAMGMQEPKDIMSVLGVIKEEFEKFELENMGTWFWIFNDDNTLTQWDISEIDLNGTMANVNITIDLDDSFAISSHKPKMRSEGYYNVAWQEDRLQALIEEIIKLDPENGDMFKEAVNEGRITSYWQACAPFSRGVLGLDYAFEPPEHLEPILKKMASAFDMAYRRFEDLQEAERRAGESRIESALERIRSQSLAMQSSDELRNVADVLYEQMRKLDQPLLEGSALHFYEKHDDEIEAWYNMPSGVTSDDHIAGQAFFPKDSCWVTSEWLRKYESNEKVYDIFTSKKQQKEWLDVLKSHAPSVGSIASIDEPQPTHMHFVDFSGGAMVVVSLDPISDDTKSLQKRAAAVFDLAYRRYEDLKLAEYQAYESRVEASLERVRGMAAAMNHSDDLMQIAEAMFREMEILKINPLRYGLGIIDKEAKEAELWASTVNDGHYLDMLGNLSLTWHPMLMQVLDAWDAQHEELIYELKGKELNDYYRRVGKINPEIPDLEKLQDPKTDIVHYVSFFPFKTGTLYAFTDGEPDEDGRSILKRFANVFEQAHIRYGDLKTAEMQARQIMEERDRLADTIKELRATQEQLVQQEKLAGLGQLTAGIAHEIKNPLNFVNNFSDVSLELVEEAREEVRLRTGDGRRETEDGGPGNPPLSRGEDGPNPQMDLILEILNDIEANLKTIHKHGTRADSIVKSMLQHSRGGSGKMEPTKINNLIKEYTNLAFHGMRAGKDAFNLDLDLDLEQDLGDVNLIAEDFSRVLLNLCNNAFDAMRDKITSSSEISENYLPKLSVRTKRNGSSVTIEVEDNGSGIPDEIKDKIMQPFFTTKKGTQGTGLGLSITNDIIKAHGGTLEVATNLFEGTRFTIQLPATS